MREFYFRYSVGKCADAVLTFGAASLNASVRLYWTDDYLEMKRCPECQRPYDDETLKYCLDDGTSLVYGPGSGDSRTELLSPAHIDREAPTRDLSEHGGLNNTSIGTTERTVRFLNRLSMRLWLLLGLTVVLIGSGYFVYRQLVGSPNKQVESIAVMPFINQSGNSDLEYLSDGMTETLISSLSQIPRLNVKARSSVFRYKGKDIDVKTIGKELSVQTVLNGNITQRANELVLHIELVDASTENALWSRDFKQPALDLVSLQSDVAREVSQRLRAKLSNAEEQLVSKTYTTDSEAYQFYLKGRYHLNEQSEEGYKQSIYYFQQAIDKDPSYALAYAGLADAYIIATDWYLPNHEAMPMAKTAAIKALEIDDTLAEGHMSLGTIRAFYDWNWQDAETEYKRTIELNPNFGDAHDWYSFYLGVIRGQNAEAVAEAKQALQLDPLSLNANCALTDALTDARQYDAATKQARTTIDLDQNYWWPHLQLGRIYERQARFPEAIAENQLARQLDNNPLILGTLGRAFAGAGRLSEAQRMIGELKALSGQRYVSSIFIAEIYAALGERDKAFEWLEKGFSERAVGMLFLRIDPIWDTFRTDQRFHDLLRRVNLPD
jgi:TolB-like protein